MCSGLNAAGLDAVDSARCRRRALLRDRSARDRRRRPDHRIAQPAGVQRHQDGRDGWFVYGEAIQEMRELIEAERLRDGARGDHYATRFSSDYVARSASGRRLERPGARRARLRQRHGQRRRPPDAAARRRHPEVTCLYCESDGTFPNHHPDPTVDENLVDLIARVRETGADLGIGFDGDADRIGAVDGDGRRSCGATPAAAPLRLDVLERLGAGRKSCST
jgi:hypothetical protein